MLKIPEPLESTQLKLKMSANTKNELDTYVAFLKTQQPHATADNVVETMIKNTIPRVGRNAKAYNDFKKSLKKL